MKLGCYLRGQKMLFLLIAVLFHVVFRILLWILWIYYYLLWVCLCLFGV